MFVSYLRKTPFKRLSISSPSHTVLAMMKEEFTLGYIQMIDGEKDPRNLLTIFRLTLVVITNFPIG